MSIETTGTNSHVNTTNYSPAINWHLILNYYPIRMIHGTKRHSAFFTLLRQVASKKLPVNYLRFKLVKHARQPHPSTMHHEFTSGENISIDTLVPFPTPSMHNTILTVPHTSPRYLTMVPAPNRAIGAHHLPLIATHIIFKHRRPTRLLIGDIARYSCQTSSKPIL